MSPHVNISVERCREKRDFTVASPANYFRCKTIRRTDTVQWHLILVYLQQATETTEIKWHPRTSWNIWHVQHALDSGWTYHSGIGSPLHPYTTAMPTHWQNVEHLLSSLALKWHCSDCCMLFISLTVLSWKHYGESTWHGCGTWLMHAAGEFFIDPIDKHENRL